MLRTVRTVIVDEIHAVIGTRRGAHLALSLERLQAGGRRGRCCASACRRRRSRSKTVAQLPGRRRTDADCAIVDEGHRRAMDLAAGGAAVAARSGDVARGLGGVLRSPRRADSRAPHHAGVRQHAAAGRARGAPSERAARRRRGHGASRQPVEGEAARRRDAAERRRSCRRSSRRRRSSSASTSATSISSARSDRRIASRRSCSASAARATPSPARRRGGVFPMSRDDLIECAGAAARRPPRRARRDRHARRAARRPRAADRRRDRVRASTARTSCSRWCGGRGRIARSTARAFDAVAGDGRRKASRRRRGRRGALVHRDEVQRTASAAGAARGCWRSPPAARFPRSPTTASCSIRTTRSSAR